MLLDRVVKLARHPAALLRDCRVRDALAANPYVHCEKNGESGKKGSRQNDERRSRVVGIHDLYVIQSSEFDYRQKYSAVGVVSVETASRDYDVPSHVAIVHISVHAAPRVVLLETEHERRDAVRATPRAVYLADDRHTPRMVIALPKVEVFRPAGRRQHISSQDLYL